MISIHICIARSSAKVTIQWSDRAIYVMHRIGCPADDGNGIVTPGVSFGKTSEKSVAT